MDISLFGIPGILGAALGFVAVFASATNTWFVSMIIAWEILIFNVFIPAILVVTFSFFSNFDYSIYSSSLLSESGLKKRLFNFLSNKTKSV